MADQEIANADEDGNKAIVDYILAPFKTRDGGYQRVRVFMDLAVNKEPLGRLEIDLQNIDKCPMTVANFVGLCTGTYVSDEKWKNLHYKGTSLFRMVPKFCVCGGDVTNDNGTNGRCIFNQATFKYEKSGLTHDTAGIVSTLQQAGGPNTNGSQFCILLTPAPWLDKVNVPFGTVTRGLETLEKICENYGTSTGVQSSNSIVRVFDCGMK